MEITRPDGSTKGKHERSGDNCSVFHRGFYPKLASGSQILAVLIRI